jgi:hypothetical protein
MSEMPANDIPITFWISAEQLDEFMRLATVMGSRQAAFDKLLEALRPRPAPDYEPCPNELCEPGCCSC